MKIYPLAQTLPPASKLSSFLPRRFLHGAQLPSPALLLRRSSPTISLPLPSFHNKLCISMRLEGSSMETPGFETNRALRYTEDKPGQPVDEPVKSCPYAETVDGKLGMDVSIHEEVPVQRKRAAKIHDFCFGIPFGAFVFGGGLVGFLFSRNPAILRTGVLFGVGLLALSAGSLNVWRRGKSSSPFIMGQSVIAAVLLGKHFQMYSLTRKLFPTGLYALLCAAMLCFYSYVMVSGGNPPKKLRSTETPAS